MSSIPKIVLHDPEGHRHEILRERVADDSINVDETPATKSIGGKVQLAGSVLKLVSQMCFTTWNERYLVLQGGYIFKFDSPQVTYYSLLVSDLRFNRVQSRRALPLSC
eukprot:TRINITY_DN4401_c0_g1_i2.p1 TRINITY_DN4401_c0_g1~~TRINITY_DN4401_c0_g1_i2.p1  ORF type:complete len:108 (-),score=16.96 TRINITY_DN4401_c0_g1_i2:357-680(-)